MNSQWCIFILPGAYDYRYGVKGHHKKQGGWESAFERKEKKGQGGKEENATREKRGGESEKEGAPLFIRLMVSNIDARYFNFFSSDWHLFNWDLRKKLSGEGKDCSGRPRGIPASKPPWIRWWRRRNLQDCQGNWSTPCSFNQAVFKSKPLKI